MATATKTTKKTDKKTEKKSTKAKPSNAVKKANATKKKANAKKATAKKTAPKKTAPKKSTAKNTAKKTAPKKENSKHVEGNPYRAGSNYAVCFDCLAELSKDKPVSRKTILDEYCKASGKERKKASWDLSVVLSPKEDGSGHRSSRSKAYYVTKMEDGLVQLHMAK